MMNTADPEKVEHRPRRLRRARKDRLVAGVAGGLGRYFNLDPLFFRVALVALVIFGGAGIAVYLLAWVLIPLESAPGEHASRRVPLARRAALVAGFALLAAGALALLDRLFSVIFAHDWPLAAVVVDPALVGLLAGYLWMRLRRRAKSGRRLGPDAVTLMRMAFVVAVAGVLTTLALGSALLAGSGDGKAAAIVVLATGVLLAASAFSNDGHGRWLIVPVLTVAIAAGIATVARVDIRGGVGDRYYRPTSLAQLRSAYRLGAGRLELDLRSLRFQPGDETVELKLGVGEAVVIVPRDLCVATSAHIGIGYVGALERRSGGVEVAWHDDPRPPASSPRLVIESAIGIGTLEVAHSAHRDRHLGEQSLGSDDACFEPNAASGGGQA
jgi:phage shock protein PspC (stress-responsive transcriptional regulator)